MIGVLRYMPAPAFIPLLIIWLGLGESSKIALLVIGTMFFNTLMSADAAALVPEELIDASYTLGASRWTVVRKVILPHSLPGPHRRHAGHIAATWNLVMAELIAAQEGLGYRIARAQRFLKTDQIFAVLIMIGVIGVSIDLAFRASATLPRRGPSLERGGGTAVKLQTIGLTRMYESFLVLDSVDIHLGPGELVTLVGASGCGKSTLLAIVAGLVAPTGGDVLLDGHPVRGPGPDRGLVFQSYTLYPWRTVRENVAFGLELKKRPKAEIRERVDHYLDVMSLRSFADALPKQLSGGMKQRVAIARALVNEPEVLLLDEPFGALDAQTRGQMQEFLLDIWRTTGTTILLVTHDVEEAVFLSQRIYVLSSHPGRVMEEVDVPFDADRTATVLRDDRFHASPATSEICCGGTPQSRWHEASVLRLPS